MIRNAGKGTGEGIEFLQESVMVSGVIKGG